MNGDSKPLAEKGKASQVEQPLCYRRIVVKLGSALLTAGGDRLDLALMASLVDQIARLLAEKAEVIVVTSGAMAVGRHRLNIKQDRKETPFRQVLAAVGQSHLMHVYDQLFAELDIIVAQTLLTRHDLADRLGYLNARNTLLSLLEHRVVPVVNENDVVAVEEIAGAKIGDNDNLSALVANLVDADLLAILSDIGGLYTADPYVDPAAKLVSRVDRIDETVEAMASGGRGPGIGGMITKIQAARLATASGTDVVIASGKEPEVMARLAHGEAMGTLFPSAVDKVESRKRWMLSGLSSRGSMVVDDGAAQAIVREGRSLLPAGVREVQGAFRRGDVVTICDSNGRRIALGIANYNTEETVRICGLRSDRIEEVLGYHYGSEVVHRNNLVAL
jgi:glutamate 5-kinase